MNESTLVLVDGDAAVAGPVALARAAAGDGTVAAVVVGPRAVAEQVAASGVDEVLWLGEPGPGVPVEAWAAPVAEVVAAAAPRLVVATTRDGGRALAGAVAARCGAPVLTGATSVALDAAGGVVVERDVHGGIASRTERVTGGPAVVTVQAGGAVASVAVPVTVTETPAAPSSAVRVREERASGRESVDLGGARVVVGIGRGLKAREDLAVVERLAAALGGEVACSRPLAEGHDWLTKDRYIGISGQHVAPDLYVAAGISGQVQHMVGVAGAKVVVAINSDPDAPIFAQCDHGVVGDLYAVLPALAAALEA